MPGKQKESLLSFSRKSIFPVITDKKALYALFLKQAPYLILILTALLYSRAFFSGFNNFDDDSFILNNPLVKDISWKGIQAIFTTFSTGKYQPLTTFSFAIEYNYFGFKPSVYHFTDVMLHLLCTLYVFKITERLSGNRITAIVVAVLFAVHPMHVEEVAWASERKDLLYAIFYLIAMKVYLEYTDSGFRFKYYLYTFLLFLLSLLSKTEAITLPLIMIVMDVYTGRKINAKALLEKLPFLLVSVFFVVIGLLSQSTGGALGQLSTAPYGIINRIFLFTSVFAFYIVKLIAPFGLSAMHYYPDMHNGALPWLYYTSLPFLVFIVWFVARRSLLRKEMIFGISFFVATISVMPQIVSVGPSLTPERYTYIPYIGFFFIIGQWIASVALTRYKLMVAGLFSLFIIVLCVQTWLRIGVWKNTDTLSTDAIEKNTDVANCSLFYCLRANYRFKAGDIPGSIDDFSEAVKEDPNYFEAYCNRGAAYFQTGDMKAAMYDFDKALHINPKDARSYSNRAGCKASTGDFTGALADYDSFLKLQPGDKTAYADRGMVRLNLKDTTGACEDWNKAAALGNDMAVDLLQHFCAPKLQL